MSLPTDEIVRQQVPSRCKKGKKISDYTEIQQEDSLGSGINDLVRGVNPSGEQQQNSHNIGINDQEMVFDSSEDDDDIGVIIKHRLSDSTGFSRSELNPFASEFVPSSVGTPSSFSVLPPDSGSRGVSSDATQSCSTGESVNDVLGKTRNISVENSSLGSSGKVASEVADHETTTSPSTQPVLRRTSRQSRVPQRYQDFILYH